MSDQDESLTMDNLGSGIAPHTKNFAEEGHYLIWRRMASGELRKGTPENKVPEGGPPRFRHPTYEEAEKEARRLLENFPKSSFVILQEIARVKMKPVNSTS